MPKMDGVTQETLQFQAEIPQLLDLMVHSLYSNKEIFLRELISNASDAIDRLRFAALSEPSLLDQDSDFAIHVTFDAAARTITVADNGIGMTRDEVIAHIGTIAKSGTRDFLSSLTGDQQKDATLIGQFGVGFYASFIVADSVTLVTRKAGLAVDHAVRWVSDGRGSYTIEPTEKGSRGTEVILHLREDQDDLLNGYQLRTIIRKYSDHISVPILMAKEADKEADAEALTEEQVNKASALWARPKSEISPEEYDAFYKHIAPDYEEPLAFIHSRMEGNYEYILLLYIPKHAPFDLWSRDQPHGVKLYVRRVFIMDDAEQLLPRYLRFVRGVVDSNDLPLNVSREILQQNRTIQAMRTTITKKLLGLLTEIASQEPEKYTPLWENFGKVLKEGIIEDSANRDQIAKLLRFASTQSEGKQDVSLETYLSHMPAGQDTIYYLNAENYQTALNSPLLEVFIQKGVEVLLLYDPVDFVLETELTTFEGKSLQSVAKGKLDLSQVNPKDAEQATPEEPEAHPEELAAFLERLQSALSEQIKATRVSTRLTTSPACLVNDEQDLDPSLRRLLEATGQTVPKSKLVLEVNPHHAIIERMRAEENAQRFADWAFVLFDQSLLSRGDQLENPVGFVNRLNGLLAQLG